MKELTKEEHERRHREAARKHSETLLLRTSRTYKSLPPEAVQFIINPLYKKEN